MDRQNMERKGPGTDRKINVFISYAHEDDDLRVRLDNHLSVLKRNTLIEVWYDRDIRAGKEWEREIATHLNTADMILLLVSPAFIASDYCYSAEMLRAMERHEHGEARVIPVILRPVDWQRLPFGKLQALPKDAKPIMSSGWHTLDEAFVDVAKGIRQVVEGWTKRSYKEQGNSTSMPPGALLSQYTGHSDQIVSVAWSPNGKHIASGSRDGIVQVWNLGDGEQSFTFNISDQVPSLAWSPDGKRITLGSRDGRVQMWNLDDRKQSLKSFTFNASGPVVWSPDGKRIVFASRDGTVQVWNPDDREYIFIHKGHVTWLDPLGPAIAVAWSPDSRRVASAYKDGTVQVWNAAGSGQPFIYKGHFNWLASFRQGSLMWSPDGKRIASAFIDKTVQVWNPDAREYNFTYKGHRDYVKLVVWSPNGKRIASASRDGIVQVWNPDNGEQIFTFNASGPVAWSPDGKRITFASRDGIVQVWNLDDREQSFTFNASGPVAWSPDGKRIASGSSDHTVQVWSAR